MLITRGPISTRKAESGSKRRSPDPISSADGGAVRRSRGILGLYNCSLALPLGSCLKLRSSLTYGLHLPSIDRPRNRAGKFYRALLRRLAQAVAGDPLAVRVVVRNPGHSRRACVPLSCGRRAPRHHGNSCDAHYKAGEHHGGWTHVHVPCSCGASITRRRARDR